MFQQSPDEYIPRDDESEAAQIRDAAGVGEENHILTSEDVKSYALDDYNSGYR